MEAYKCYGCGEIFTDLTEDNEVNGMEIWAICPKCHGDDYIPTHICDYCGTEEESLTNRRNGICHQCLEKSYKPEYALYFIERCGLAVEAFQYVIGLGPEIKTAVRFLNEEVLINALKAAVNKDEIKEDLKNFCLDDMLYSTKYSETYINEIVKEFEEYED